jgi:hypothetical protein
MISKSWHCNFCFSSCPMQPRMHEEAVIFLLETFLPIYSVSLNSGKSVQFDLCGYNNLQKSWWLVDPRTWPGTIPPCHSSYFSSFFLAFFILIYFLYYDTSLNLWQKLNKLAWASRFCEWISESCGWMDAGNRTFFCCFVFLAGWMHAWTHLYFWGGHIQISSSGPNVRDLGESGTGKRR